MNATTMNRLAILAIVLPTFCMGGAEPDESQPDPLLPMLATAQDAMRPARGLALSFARAFSTVRDLRLDRGVLGYGWRDDLSLCVERRGRDTIFVRLPSGDRQEFVKVDDQWRSLDWRDVTKVTETSAAFVFAFESGTVRSFSKENGRTSFIQDNKGNVLSFTWDGDRLQRAVHTDGQCLSFSYSADGLLSSVVDDCGRKTEYSYKDDLLTEVKSSDGLVTRYEYYEMDGSPSSRAIRRVVRSDGTARAYEFDERGLVSAIVANGVRTEIRRRNGRTALIVAPDGGTTKVEFGEAGEILQTTDALGNTAKFAYGDDGLLESIISPSGKEASLFYDSRGRVKSVTSPSGAKMAFAYKKSFGNLASVTDANGQAVSFEYDDAGRGVSVMHPDGTASKVGYSPRGDAVSVLNRRGQTIKVGYDAQGRPVRKVWSNGRTFAYVYDMRGNLLSASDSETGAVRMEYDAAGRMTRITYPKGRGLSFKYDAAGRLVERTLFDGTAKSSLVADVERFAYNDAGSLASVSDGAGRKYIQNAYDSKTGRLTQQTCGNGVASEYDYDRLGRIVSIRHTGVSAARAFFEYSYDSDGKCRTTRSDEGNEAHEYDADGQLTAVIYPDGKKESFKYDAVGNRVSANGIMYMANALNQYTEIVGEVTHVSATYDLDGNLTSLADKAGKTQYWYDVQNRLVAVTNETAGIRWCCQYDALGNRVSVTDNGITTERVMIPGVLSSVAAEFVDGKLATRHIVVGVMHVATLTVSHSSLTPAYYHGDIIGSARLVTDGAGKEIDRASYAVFGALRNGKRQGLLLVGYVGMLGVETDPTGLLFMRNRYYSPTLGRFIQPDPIGLNGEDVNWYRYCGNDAIQCVDMSGLKYQSGVENICVEAMNSIGEGVTQTCMDVNVVYLETSEQVLDNCGKSSLAGCFKGSKNDNMHFDIYVDARQSISEIISTKKHETMHAIIRKYFPNTDKFTNELLAWMAEGKSYWDAAEIIQEKYPEIDLPEDVKSGLNKLRERRNYEKSYGEQKGSSTHKKRSQGQSPKKNQHNRRERKERGSDEDSDRELSEGEIPDPDADGYIWCEDVCEGRPLVPPDTAHCIYWGCARCGHVIRKQAKKAKRQERIWKSKGIDCWWHGTQFEVRQAKSAE